jgi:hypothetical protein
LRIFSQAALAARLIATVRWLVKPKRKDEEKKGKVR